MANGPRNKVWPHLEKKPKRFPEEPVADARARRGRVGLRRMLAGAALVVALIAIYPVIQQERREPHEPTAATVTDCDRLAAHPSDTQKLAPGIVQDEVDTAAGKTACHAALQARPKDGRTLYQLGRMYFYEKDFTTGIGYMRQSAEAGYAQGQFVLGLVLVQGNGTDPDPCAGGKLWESAARQRHLYSKIYLADNWRDGMFEGCGLTVTEAEIEAMLAAAEDLAVTQREHDDLAQARQNWTRR